MTRVAVVGYGRVGEAHAACYSSLSGVHLAAVADLCAPRRQAAAAQHPGAQIVNTLDEVTAPFDLAVICTPPTSHEPLIENTLRRGAHVFCEKPTFLDPARAEQLTALATARELIIYPGHNYVFSPMLNQLRTAAANGTIGEIQHLTIQINRTGPAAGTPDWQPRWRTDIKHSGGGILTDHGPHCIYLTEWLAGARIRTATTTTDTTDIDHDAAIDLSLTGGITASVGMSWRAGSRTSRYRITGTTGAVSLNGNRLYGPGDRPGEEGIHETAATSHAHDDWMPALARDVIASLTEPHRLPTLTESATTIARILLAGRRKPRKHG